MGEIKIRIEDEVEESFRYNAMKEFGFRKGSISIAAEEAIKEWVEKHEGIKNIENPVKAIKGMLKHIKKGSVELQHESYKIRGDKYFNRRKHIR